MEYQKKDKEEKKRVELEEKKEGKECPNCHNINEPEAHFCAECGYDLREVKKCPKCGAKITSPNADICEVCGEWLLEGKCKFCYADLEEGANYCPECGNPVAGITCPQCGKLSYFDFCKFCNIPLTEMGKKTKENLKNDPLTAELMRLIEESTVETKERVSAEKIDELLKMKEYMKKVSEKEKKRVFTPIFTKEQREAIAESGKKADEEIRRIEEEKRRQEEERRRKEEEERQRMQELMKQMAQKSFNTNQEARRFYRSIRPKRAVGWCCNFTRTVHPCPEDCAEPWHGGYWVTD